MAAKRSSGGARRTGLGADAAMASAIVLLGAFLAASGAQLAQRLQSSAARRQSLSFEDQIGVAAHTTGLIVVVWWVLSFLIAFAAALLERRGSRRAAAAAGRFSPAFMRRLALAAVGLQLATAPLAHAAPDPAGPAAYDAVTPPAVTAAWVPTAGALDPDPHWTPGPTPVDPQPLTAGPLRPPGTAAGAAEVTVRAGDSLWSICTEQLGPLASDVDVALAWPRLYQANRELIGADPGVLLPGQVLKLPAAP